MLTEEVYVNFLGSDRIFMCITVVFICYVSKLYFQKLKAQIQTSLGCEQCGAEKMEETPKRYGLTNLACIRMAVTEFELMKQEFRRNVLGGLEGGH